MTSDWRALETELRHWRIEGLALPIWWRDDDAISVTSPLERLTVLAHELQVPCHLAVIPKHATEDLAVHCAATPLIVPMVHGFAHENHARQWQKKAEFGNVRPGLVAEATLGRQQMDRLFGAEYLQCFVPPWNRIVPELVSDLASLGYGSLSTFTPRATRLAAPGLVQINTHLDPINWRGGGGMVDDEHLLSQLITLLHERRSGRVDRAEPLGLLTHHLVHDDAVWCFTQRCLATLLDGGATPLNLFELKDDLP